MKVFVASMLIGLTLFIVSCGASRGGHCDAYGSIEQAPAGDLAQK